MRSSSASSWQSLKQCRFPGISRENRDGRPLHGWSPHQCAIGIVMRLPGKLLPAQKNFCRDIAQAPVLLPCLFPFSRRL